jgi:hypothetical protein
MEQRTFSRSRWRNDRNHFSFAQLQVCIGQNFQFFSAGPEILPQSARFQHHFTLRDFSVSSGQAHQRDTPPARALRQGFPSHHKPAGIYI